MESITRLHCRVGSSETVIDAHKLFSNLQEDRELTLAAVHFFTQAIAHAIPTGKQNTFAAHNPPSFIGVTLRHSGPINLANALEKPISAKCDKPITELSVEALAAHEQQLSHVYGDSRDEWAFLDLTGSWPSKKELSRKT